MSRRSRTQSIIIDWYERGSIMWVEDGTSDVCK
jgi:hypothetical protein